MAPSAAGDKREPPAVSAATEKREPPAVSAAGGKREPSGVSAATEKREPPARRVSSALPHPPPVPIVTLPEEIVLKAMSVGQTQFIRCWKRAQQADPGLDSAKVRMHLEVDATGKVISVKSDTESAVLARCLASVARQLPFPAPGRLAVVDLPLMFP
jgi:hypothetical protein